MTESSHYAARPTDSAGSSVRELAAVGGLLAAVVALELLLSGSWGLVTQIPWLDECLALLVVNDGSFTHGLAAIRGGVENTPPGFFMVMWPIARAFGGLTPAEFRLFVCLFAILGVVAVYATCRLFVDRRRAALGALVVVIHPAVVVQLFQLRFYTFWLAGTAWLVYFTVRQAFEPERKRFLYWRCLLAALVVATHWFGVIGVGLITAADFLTKRDARRRVNAALPMIIGILTLAACYPFLAAQRTGLTVATWMEPTTVSGLVRELRAIAGIVPISFIVMAALYSALTRARWKMPREGWIASAPAFALVLFPLMLIALSLAMQPVVQAKYMIPLVIPIGILAAFAAPPPDGVHPARFATFAGILLIAAGVVGLRRNQDATGREVATLDRALAAADSLNSAGVRPIVFLRRAEQYPVLARRPELAAVTSVVDFDDDGAGLSRMWVFERDMTRRVNRVYPDYRLAPVDSLSGPGQFVVIARPEDEAILRQVFPGHEASSVAAGVYAVVRR